MVGGVAPGGTFGELDAVAATPEDIGGLALRVGDLGCIGQAIAWASRKPVRATRLFRALQFVKLIISKLWSCLYPLKCLLGMYPGGGCAKMQPHGPLQNSTSSAAVIAIPIY